MENNAENIRIRFHATQYCKRNSLFILQKKGKRMLM